MMQSSLTWILKKFHQGAGSNVCDVGIRLCVVVSVDKTSPVFTKVTCARRCCTGENLNAKGDGLDTINCKSKQHIRVYPRLFFDCTLYFLCWSVVFTMLTFYILSPRQRVKRGCPLNL